MGSLPCIECRFIFFLTFFSLVIKIQNVMYDRNVIPIKCFLEIRTGIFWLE